MTHAEKVRQSGSGKFMEQYYVGYGHASIGDCGSTTIYFENVSMLVAKAVQDHPLYSGQEASTRYLDFATQPMIDPYDRPESAAIQNEWIALYTAYMPKVKAALAKAYPFDPANYRSEIAWDKAIAARAFDTLRCLLPVGTATLASWHTNLRQARDHLRRLAHHPLPEIRNTAQTAYAKILKKYPNSFKPEDVDPASERHRDRNAFLEADAEADHFLLPEAVLAKLEAGDEARLRAGEVVADVTCLNAKTANQSEGKALAARPQGTPLPRRLMQYGVYNIYFLLDFGSYRDIQRHRNGYCPNPLVGGQFGFHRWYLKELERLLNAEDFAALKAGIDQNLAAIATLPFDHTPLLDQYLYPMGMACLCQLSYSIPQMVYVAELRSGQTVHPSLRPVAQALGRVLKATLPALNVYCDNEPDSFSAKRGEQDIVERKKELA